MLDKNGDWGLEYDKYVLILSNGVFMKFSAIVLAVLAAVSAVSASANPYVQGNVSRSTINANQEQAPAGRIAVGTDTGAFRYAADYTHFGRLKDEVHHSAGTNSVSFDVNSIGVSAIADIANTNSTFVPYVGARVGYSHLDSKAVVNTAERTVTVKDNKKSVGAGLLAGVQYNVNQNLAIDAGLEYNRLGTVKLKDEFGNVVDKLEPTQKSLSLGVRYNF